MEMYEMPIDYKQYPINWKTEIRPAILKRANNACEECGVKNYEQGYRDAEGKWYEANMIMDALDNTGYDYFDHELKNCYHKNGEPTRCIKIVLTISHTDHNINNNDHSNLKALCQRCHNRYDNKNRVLNRKKKKRQTELF